MGANQSSKAQLAVAQHQQTSAEGILNGRQPTNGKQQHQNKGSASLGSSLRKSVGNVLSTNKLSSKGIKSSTLNGISSIKSAKTRLANNNNSNNNANNIVVDDDEPDELDARAGGERALNQSRDSYYITSDRQLHAANMSSKSGRMLVPAASSANNYVTMHQANGDFATTLPESAFCYARQGDFELSVGSNNNKNINNNNYYGKSGASFGVGHFGYAPSEQPDSARDGSFIVGSAQDHNHRQQQQQQQLHPNQSHNNQLEHHNYNVAALNRSSQQQVYHQSSTQQPFVHLSRAVNTKTKRVLNNTNVAMPNSDISGSQLSRRLHQQHSLLAADINNGASTSLLVQNSPQQQQQQQQQQQNSRLHNQSTQQTNKQQNSYPYHCSNQSPSANNSSASLAHRSGNANEQQSPLCHKRQQHQQRRPQTHTAYSNFEDSENSFMSSSSKHHQYYLRNCLLGPQQTDLDMNLSELDLSLNQHHQQQQQLQMNALQRGYNQPQSIQPYGAQYRPLDFHQLAEPAEGGFGAGQLHLRPLATGAGQLGDQLTLDSRNYTRSQSFGGGGSRTLDVAKKKNPLAALFQNSANSASKKHSNTIHLGRRNKSSSILPNFNTSSLSNNTNSNNQRSAPGSLKRIKPAPLTAQQASYEAMRTIDMYLIRQIARSCMDFEMEQKIDLEIRLRELAAQSMLEAQNEIDVLEVEKSLLTSDQRMNCYASLLEEQRKQLSNPSLSTADSGRGSKSGNQQHRRSQSRPDVIGAIGGGGTATSGTGTTTTSGVASSPSFSSSVSNSQSPSKLSPVSGESANSPSFTTNSSQHSRQLGLRSQSSAHNNNTLSTKQRAKNKQRERLMQSITSLSNINCNIALNNRASVSVSEIRIPLMWRDVDHFKNRGDYKRFAIFCLLKIDSQIYDTQLISDVDRQVTDVTFDDLVVFNEIEHNFELSLEVYSCVYLEHFSLSSTPRKLKEKLTSSVSRAMGRRLAAQTASTNYTKDLQAYDKSYRFALISSATLRLSDASDSVKTYDLVLVSPGAHNRHYQATDATTQTSNNKDADKNTLPLFGHFCCKLLVKPDVFDKSIKTGYLRVATISVPNNNNNNIISSTQNSHSGSSDRVSDSPHNTTDSCSDATTESAAKLRTSLMAASSKMATLSLSTSRVHWGLLRNFALHLWPIDDQDLELALQRGELPLLDNPRKPRLTLTIDKYARLLRVSNSSLTLETDKGCFVLGIYCPETCSYGPLNQADEISHWLRSIEQLIYDSHIWGTVLNHYPPHTRHSISDEVINGRSTSASTRWSNNANSNNMCSSGRINRGKQKQHQRHYYAPGAMLHADL